MALIHDITSDARKQKNVNPRVINDYCLSLAEWRLILHRAFFRIIQLSFDDNCELILKPRRMRGLRYACITLDKNHSGSL